MRESLQVKVAQHIQAARQSADALWQRPLATFMTVIVIAIALALPSILWVFTDNVGQLTNAWRRGGRIALYLKPGLSEAGQKAVLKKIQGLQGVGEARLTTASEGLAELTKQEGMQDIMNYLPENPLPAVIEIVPSLEVDAAAKWDLLARQLRTLSEAEQVKVDMEWITRLQAILGFAAKVAKALLLLLGLAVIVIIGTTLRLAIHNKQEEIQILKLIGATDPFILRPFLYTGLWYGVAGAFFATLLVNIFILSIGMAISHLAFVYQMHYEPTCLSLSQILLLLAIASILGWLGARLSVKRQLAAIEP